MKNSKRDIGRMHLLFISFAAIFGSGWLFAPFYAAQIAGPASLIAWLLGSAMSIVIGITMAEVIVLFPKTGGLSHVAKATHGEFLWVAVTIFNLLVFVVLPAIEVRAVLQYLSSYLKIIQTSEGTLSGIGYALAIFLLGIVTLVNLYGAKITAKITKGVVVLKVVTPIILCASFFYVLGSDAFDFSRLTNLNFSGGPAFDSIPWTQVFQAIATSGIIFSFNGFNQATLFAGEAKNPQKTIPFAILASLLVSAVLYFVIQYVFIMAIPKESFANGWDKLTFSGEEGPFAGISILLGLGWLATLIYADAVVSPLGTAFAYASAAPRVFYALTDGAESRLFKPNSKGISPLFVIVTLVLECLAFVFLPSLKAMISILVAAFVLCYTVAPTSLLLLRKTQPDLERPFRVKLAPIACYLSLFFSNLMVFSCGWIALRNLIVVSAVLFVGYFGLNSRKHGKQSVQKNLRDSMWFIFQLICIGFLCWRNEQRALSFVTICLGVGGTSLFALFLSQATAPAIGSSRGKLAAEFSN
ncbi:MAG: APC family permease [Bacteriovoracia bacterium]